MRRILRLPLLLATAAACFTPFAHAQLEPTWKAHGGADTWKSYGALAYDCAFGYGPMALRDRQSYDLHSRDGLITAKDGSYTIGAAGGEVWITPGLSALPLPARFYMWTPFYFFGLPLILSDDGVNLKAEGQAEFEGKQYDLVRATFGKGVGDAHEDFYLCYIDPESRELRLAVYIVTYAPLRQAEKLDEVPTSAAIYQEWQTVGGLKMPKVVDLYHWKDGAPDGEAKGQLRFENVEFNKERPDAAQFAKPEGAEVDNSHLAKATSPP